MNITTMTQANRNTNTYRVKLSENKNGFLTFSTLNPKAKIFTGIPYKNEFLYTFTNEPSLSQCFQQKTSPFYSALSTREELLKFMGERYLVRQCLSFTSSR
ncbi:hypothetical protein ACB092_12G216800 [Castanea dentata]